MPQLTTSDRMVLEGLSQRLKELSVAIEALELQQLELPRLKRARNFILERIESIQQCQMNLGEQDYEVPVDYFEEKEFQERAI